MRFTCYALLIGCMAAGQAAFAQAAPATGVAKSTSLIDTFRQLLAMDRAGREKALAEKPEHTRNYLAGKLREYDALTPDERELRLHLSQLRYYMLPLMKPGLTNRAERMEAIPTDDRKLIEARLAQWDRLTADLQKEVLENEWLMQTVLRFESSSPAQQKELMEAMSRDRRRRLESDLAKWHALPADKQSRMVKNFNQFFELSDKEKSRIIATVPQSQRRQMEQTIHAFEQLPAAQRTLCMKSLQRFATMTQQQQLDFFSNAERWARLTEAERETVRKLLMEFPPLPPGLGTPPLPPGLDGTLLPPPPSVLTNR